MSDIIRILIVDDEPEARELLKFMLREEEGLEVVGMAGHVDEALQILNLTLPDLVFLDIQMPEKDGFQFIEKVKQLEHEPGIVFVTAFDNYAIQAIRKSVFDYIMKPVMREELVQAVNRFRQRRDSGKIKELYELIRTLGNREPEKIKLNTRSGYSLIYPPEIVFCKADGNYSLIQMANGSQELTTQNLGSMENLLQEGSFFRVSRSYLVNLKFLVRVDRKANHCVLEAGNDTFSIKIPPQKAKLLEANFN